MKIHHDRRYTVMTNESTYDKQLVVLDQYAGFGGKKPLPGMLDATERFVWGAFYAKNLLRRRNGRQSPRC